VSRLLSTVIDHTFYFCYSSLHRTHTYIPVHAMKVCRVKRGNAPLILNLGISWRWAGNFTTRMLYPRGKSYRHPSNMMMGGPPKQVRTFWRKLSFVCQECAIYVVSSLRQRHAVVQWLRHCATNRKVTRSIPDGVTGIFHWHNPSGRTLALG
jgi:hypothetical protein